MTARLLPFNASPLERGIEDAAAPIEALPAPIRQLWDPDTCDADKLPFLAWALSIDSWSSDWPESIKRERCRQAIAIARRKGTAASVRDTVESFGGAVALREWWQTEPKGIPHTFELVMTLADATGQQLSAAFVEQVIAEVARTKPARSHFTFIQGLAAHGAIGIVGAARPITYARLALDAPAAA